MLRERSWLWKMKIKRRRKSDEWVLLATGLVNWIVHGNDYNQKRWRWKVDKRLAMNYNFHMKINEQKDFAKSSQSNFHLYFNSFKPFPFIQNFINTRLESENYDSFNWKRINFLIDYLNCFCRFAHHGCEMIQSKG